MLRLNFEEKAPPFTLAHIGLWLHRDSKFEVVISQPTRLELAARYKEPRLRPRRCRLICIVKPVRYDYPKVPAARET